MPLLPANLVGSLPVADLWALPEYDLGPSCVHSNTKSIVSPSRVYNSQMKCEPCPPMVELLLIQNLSPLVLADLGPELCVLEEF